MQTGLSESMKLQASVPAAPQAAGPDMQTLLQGLSQQSGVKDVKANTTAWEKALDELTGSTGAGFLAQLGLSLLQPIQPGGSPASHIGQAGAQALGGYVAAQNREDVKADRGKQDQRADKALQQRDADLIEGQRHNMASEDLQRQQTAAYSRQLSMGQSKPPLEFADALKYAQLAVDSQLTALQEQLATMAPDDPRYNEALNLLVSKIASHDEDMQNSAMQILATSQGRTYEMPSQVFTPEAVAAIRASSAYVLDPQGAETLLMQRMGTTYTPPPAAAATTAVSLPPAAEAAPPQPEPKPGDTIHTTRTGKKTEYVKQPNRTGR
jgi:hypothetical protein